MSTVALSSGAEAGLLAGTAACRADSGARAPDTWTVHTRAAASTARWNRGIEATLYFLPICGYWGRPWQSATTQMELSVRPGAGTGNPRASMSLRIKAEASGRSIADWTPTRTSPSA